MEVTLSGGMGGEVGIACLPAIVACRPRLKAAIVHSSQKVQGLGQRSLGSRIERACGFIEQQHWGIARYGAGQRQALLLAAREAVPAFPHHGVIALGQPAYCGIELRYLGCGHPFLVGCLSLGETQVVGHRGIQEIRLLRDHAEHFRQRLETEITGVDPVLADRTAIHVVQASQ